ncbi:MAG: hypothetical protein LBP78_04340 [Acidaminococcales bacterium]|jgi:hypothetical protein|nr:hypothetical protein [Acidaminococcales bacterium]
MFINNSLIYQGKIPAGYQPGAAAQPGAAQAASPQVWPRAAAGREEENPAYILSLSGKSPESGPESREEKADGAQTPGNAGEADGKDKNADAGKTAANSGEPWRAGKSPEEQRQIEREVQTMRQTENKVIAHEQAHKSAGGRYAGGISYDKSSGPDGRQYIVGGEVSIDMSGENTPQKTIAKMQIVRRAALAPADPSGQDRAVAAAASAKESSARQELSKNLREEAAAKSNQAAASTARQNVQGGKTLVGKSQAAENPSAQNENAAAKANYGVFKDASARKQEPEAGTWVDLSV